MNKEIKEILDNLRFNVYETKNWITPLGLNQKNWKQLLDYIINLQQENEELKAVKRQLQIRNMSLEEWYSYHKATIDKAVEYIKENFDKTGIYVSGSDLPYSYIDNLLNILQNGSEE